MKRHSLMILLSILLFAPRAAVADSILSFGPVSGSVVSGSMVTLGVEVSGAEDLYAFQFDMSYDPGVLELISIVEGSFLSSVGATSFIPGSIDNSSGVASFNANSILGPEPGASGSGVLAEFTFTAVSSGVSPLTLSTFTLLDSQGGDLPAVALPGNLVVDSVPEPSTIWLVLAGAFTLAHQARRSAVTTPK